MRHRHSILAVAGCAAIFLSFALSHEASALTIQDIIVMQQQGVPENVILSVIDNAEDFPTLTKNDYDKLKNNGISSKIMAQIALRIKNIEEHSSNPPPVPNIETSAADANVASPTSDDETTPTALPVPPDHANADLPQPPSPANAPDASQNDASPQDDAPTQSLQETILAPIETSNAPAVMHQFFEELRHTFLVESELARRHDEMKSQNDDLQKALSELPTVEQYRKEIQNGKPIRALDSCLAMLNDKNPDSDTALAATLYQCIGESLGALGAKGMGAAYLDAALQAKATVGDYAKTFETFLNYAHDADYASVAPLKIRAHESEIDQNSTLGQRYRYFIAYSLVYGPNPNIDESYKLLQAIPSGTLEFARARMLMAAIDVRAPAFRFKTAAEHIGQALTTLENLNGDTAFQLKNSAWLTLARIAYENHAYDSADAFFKNVDIHSHQLKNALVESAWNAVFAKRYHDALAITHALRAPAFAKAWLPDVGLIEANAFLTLCRYQDAETAIEKLRKTYISDAETLQKIVEQTPARDFYNQLLRHTEAPETSPLPMRIYYRVLSDLPFKRLRQSLQTLSAERDKLSRFASQDFTSWQFLEKTYHNAMTYRQNALSQRLNAIYDDVIKQIHALDVSAAQVAIEIRLSERKREADCLKIVANGGKCNESTAFTSHAITKAPNEVYWNFDREFWRDEMRSFVSALPSLCPNTDENR